MIEGVQEESEWAATLFPNSERRTRKLWAWENSTPCPVGVRLDPRLAFKEPTVTKESCARLLRAPDQADDERPCPYTALRKPPNLQRRQFCLPSIKLIHFPNT
jgi:hypothetical protein